MERKANNSADMERKNRGLLMRMIREGNMSRAELARKAGLTRAAVTVIVDGLMKEEIVLEGETASSDVGRRPIMLKINPEARFAAGVDISMNGVSVGITDIGGKVIAKNFLRYDEEREDLQQYSEELVVWIAGQITEMIAEHRIPTEKNLGIGVSAPGPIDSAGGRILDAPHLKVWKGFEIVKALEERLGMKVFLEKDANVMALAEKNNRAMTDNFLFIIGDNGLGGGFIKKGRLYRGTGGFGSEIGHISIKYDGEKCRCGNRGCAELYASIPSLLKQARKNGLPVSEWSELVDMAYDGNEAAGEMIAYAADMLAITCVNASNVIEPEQIVLGGKFAYRAEQLAEMIEKRIAETAMTRKYHHIGVEASVLPKDADLSAAAGLAIEKFFLLG